MDCSTNNKKIISLGENLRSRYLYGMQEGKDIISFLIARNHRKQFIKRKILKLIECSDV